jgi:hypothetical protein
MTKTLRLLDIYSLFETISYLRWKVYKFYKNEGHSKFDSGRIATRVCIKRFGYENYQSWRYRFQDERFSQLYYDLKS